MKDPKREFPEIMSFLEGYVRRLFDIGNFPVADARYVDGSLRVEDRGIIFLFLTSNPKSNPGELVYLLSRRNGKSDEELLEGTVAWSLFMLEKDTMEEAVIFLSAGGYM